MKFFLSALVALFLMIPTAKADLKYAIEAGVRQQSGDTDSSASTSSQTGLQFGATANIQMKDKLHLRTGMLYTQRNLTVDTTPNNKVELSYLDIPVTLMYMFEEYAGVFLGVNLSLNLDKKASEGSVTGLKSEMLPLVFGASFKFHPDFGVSIYYESASGKVADGLKDYRAVGANLLITFD